MMSRPGTSRITALAYRQWRLMVSTVYQLLPPMMEPFLYLVIFASIMGTILPEVIYEGVSYSYLTFIVPGILAIGAFTRGIHGGTPIFVDRMTGELETLFGLPVRRNSLLLSNVSAITIHGLLYSVVLLAVGKAISPDFPWSFDRALTAIGIASLLTIISTFIFSAVCCVVRRQSTFNLLLNVILLPLTLTSTAFYPLDHAPAWIRLIASMNPITMAVDSIRHVLLAPQLSPVDLISGILPLVVIGLIAGGMAFHFFNRTLK